MKNDSEIPADLKKSETFEAFSQSVLPTGKYDTYFEAYDHLFKTYRGKPITFVEVGIMGGGALEAWKRYFGPQARIIGVDLNPELKPFLNEKGFEIFVGDQADPEFWKNFLKEVGEIDVLLDDGGHTNIQQWTTFTYVLPKIKNGGMLVMEDTHTSYIEGFGNPSELSFVSRAKACLDQINHRSSRIEDRDRLKWKRNPVLEGFEVEKHVSSVHFYESLIAFHVKREHCRKSQELSFGSLQSLPRKETPVDFRYEGISDPSMTGVGVPPPKRGLLRRGVSFLKRVLSP